MDHATTERIYIGGLDPPRLSPSEILRRLKAMDRIEILSAEDDAASTVEDTKPYIHIEVASKDPDHSALDIIAKQYHNVKWKGCKVVVEAARPHFLHRLEQERQQRALWSDKNIQPAVEMEGNSHNEVPNLPRRLRVRKKFGEEAFHIDTKPWLLDEWSDFQAARSKLEKRAEKYKLQMQQAKRERQGQRRPPILLHRALHIRFQSGEKPDLVFGDPRPHGREIEGMEMPGDSATNSDDMSSSSSSSEEENDMEQQTKNKERSYEWSDSDGNDDSNEESVDAGNTAKDNNVSTEMDNNHSFPSDEKSIDSKMAISNAKEEHRSTKLPEQNIYRWSSEEESSGEESPNISTEKRNDFLNSVEFSAADEFAAGLDGVENDESSTNMQDENIIETSRQVTDLNDDVTTNLNILSSIFPEVNSVQPAAVAAGETTDASDDVKKENSIQGATIMPRYDPSLESSKKYTALENATDIKDEEENRSETPSISQKDSLKDQDEHGQNQTAPMQETVYEQDMLESVFRDARNAWNQKPALGSTSLPSITKEKKHPSGAFTFGFDLGHSHGKGDAPQKEPPQSGEGSGGFSFSFDLPSDSAVSQHTDTKEESRLLVPATNGKTEDVPDGSAETEESASFHRPRRRGFDFPDEVLTRYAALFFSVEDDQRASQSNSSSQHDTNEREVWNRERHNLTLDWKRKRKYAMSRIQKRLKTRS